jgi:lipopolysaccharide biosynthesis regulator YciM
MTLASPDVWLALLGVVGTALFALGFWLGHREGMTFMADNPEEHVGDATYYFRGVHFLLAQEPDKAIEAFINAVRINSETVEIYLALGDLFRARGEVGRAIRIHQSLIARPALPADMRTAALFSLAEDYRQGGFLDRAAQAYHQVLASDPHSEKACRGLLAIHETEGQWEKALAALESLTRISGKSDPRRKAHLHIQIGLDLDRAANGMPHPDDQRRALGHFETAVALYPGCVEGYRLLGERLLARGQTQEAIDVLCRLWHHRPSHFFLLMHVLHKACKLHGDEQAFERTMDEAAQSAIASAPLVVQWAEWLSERRRLPEVETVLRAGMRQHPHSALLVLRLMECLVQSRKEEEALATAQGFLDWLTKQQYRFQCAQCGFEARDIHWKCPQCHHWDTMKPK